MKRIAIAQVILGVLIIGSFFAFMQRVYRGYNTLEGTFPGRQCCSCINESWTGDAYWRLAVCISRPGSGSDRLWNSTVYQDTA